MFLMELGKEMIASQITVDGDGPSPSELREIGGYIWLDRKFLRRVLEVSLETPLAYVGTFIVGSILS